MLVAEPRKKERRFYVGGGGFCSVFILDFGGCGFHALNTFWVGFIFVLSMRLYIIWFDSCFMSGNLWFHNRLQHIHLLHSRIVNTIVDDWLCRR